MIQEYILNTDDGTKVGSLEKHELPGRGHLARLWVHPDYRGQGLARRLLRNAVADADRDGVVLESNPWGVQDVDEEGSDRLLYSGSGNVPTLKPQHLEALYSSMGFVPEHPDQDGYDRWIRQPKESLQSVAASPRSKPIFDAEMGGSSGKLHKLVDNMTEVDPDPHLNEDLYGDRQWHKDYERLVGGRHGFAGGYEPELDETGGVSYHRGGQWTNTLGKRVPVAHVIKPVLAANPDKMVASDPDQEVQYFGVSSIPGDEGQLYRTLQEAASRPASLGNRWNHPGRGYDPRPLNEAFVSQQHREASRMPGSPLPDDVEAREAWHRRKVKRTRQLDERGTMPMGSSGPQKVMVGDKMYVRKGRGKNRWKLPQGFSEDHVASDTTDSEYLFHHTAEAFNALHPDVVLSPRSDDKRMDQVYVEGMPHHQTVNDDTSFVRRGLTAPGSRNIALFHAASGMIDHFDNNWGVTKEGHPITWDHEFSDIPRDINDKKRHEDLTEKLKTGHAPDYSDSYFLDKYDVGRRRFSDSSFTIAHGLTSGDKLLPNNDITPEEYSTYRDRLAGLSDKFAKRDRSNWHDELMNRWNTMWQNSKHFGNNGFHQGAVTAAKKTPGQRSADEFLTSPEYWDLVEQGHHPEHRSTEGEFPGYQESYPTFSDAATTIHHREPEEDEYPPDYDGLYPEDVDDLRRVGAEVHDDGTVSLYHHTTPEAARGIHDSGRMRGEENGLFFTTRGDQESYASGGRRSGAVVKLRIPMSELKLDDLFSDEAHLRVPLAHPGDTKDVSHWLRTANSKLGDCYRQAYLGLMEAPDGWTMMHGDMLSPLDRRPGGPYPNGHAVLLDTEGNLHDPVMGQSWPAGVWQHIYNFQPGARTFTKDEARREALERDGVAGPWHDTQTDYDQFGKEAAIREQPTLNSRQGARDETYLNGLSYELIPNNKNVDGHHTLVARDTNGERHGYLVWRADGHGEKSGEVVGIGTGGVGYSQGRPRRGLATELLTRAKKISENNGWSPLASSRVLTDDGEKLVESILRQGSREQPTWDNRMQEPNLFSEFGSVKVPGLRGEHTIHYSPTGQGASCGNRNPEGSSNNVDHVTCASCKFTRSFKMAPTEDKPMGKTWDEVEREDRRRSRQRWSAAAHVGVAWWEIDPVQVEEAREDLAAKHPDLEAYIHPSDEYGLGRIDTPLEERGRGAPQPMLQFKKEPSYHEKDMFNVDPETGNAELHPGVVRDSSDLQDWSPPGKFDEQDPFYSKYRKTAAIPDESGLKAAGIAVIALDTGRVLMQQRALNPILCPCGQGVTWDEQNGWQHDDGSVSHDEDEFYGQSVSDLLDQGHPEPIPCPCCQGAGDDLAGSECTACDGSGSDPDGPPCDSPCRDPEGLDKTAALEHDPNEGTWEMPGGKIEPGESAKAAAIREFREEVGQDLPPGVFVGAWVSPGGIVVSASVDRLAMQPGDQTYGFQEGGAHPAPSDRSYNVPLHDVESMMPGFYEGHHGDYSSGNDGDAESIGKILRYHNQPEKKIRIYRAVPHGISKIYGRQELQQMFPNHDPDHLAEWVGISKDYALEHAKANNCPKCGGHLQVISGIAQAKDLLNEGYPTEWGYVGDKTLEHTGSNRIYKTKCPAPRRGHRTGAIRTDIDEPMRRTIRTLRDPNPVEVGVGYNNSIVHSIGGKKYYEKSPQAINPDSAAGAFNEVFSSLVGRALGANVPRSIHAPRGGLRNDQEVSVFSEDIPGYRPYRDDEEYLWAIHSRPGKLLGAVDALVDVPDHQNGRNTGMNANNEPHGLDYEGADGFYRPSGVRTTSGFASHYVAPRPLYYETALNHKSDGKLITNPLTVRDVARGREALQNLRPFFEKDNWLQGHDNLMSRWDEIGAHAGGQEGEDLLPEKLPKLNLLKHGVAESSGDLYWRVFPSSVIPEHVPWHDTYNAEQQIREAENAYGGGLGRRWGHDDNSDGMSGRAMAQFYGGHGDVLVGARINPEDADAMREPRDSSGLLARRPVKLHIEQVHVGEPDGSWTQLDVPPGLTSWTHRSNEKESAARKAPVYKGFIYLIQRESDIDLGNREIANPDDPDGDMSEQSAWWEIEHAKKNPALRPEVKKGTPWDELELWADKSVRSNKEIKEALAKLAVRISDLETDRRQVRRNPKEDPKGQFSNNRPTVWNIGGDKYLEKNVDLHSAQNEFLSSLVGRALGADVSKVMLNPRNDTKSSGSILTRIQPGYEDYNRMSDYDEANYYNQAINTVRGKRIGLVDSLVNVDDHNAINHGRKPDPTEPSGYAPHSIDYEYSLGFSPIGSSSPYVEHHFYDSYSRKKLNNPLTKRDLVRGENALMKLRPVFKSMEREDDHDSLMDRWHDLANYASGVDGEDVLPESLPDISHLARESVPTSFMKHLSNGDVVHAYNTGRNQWVHRTFSGDHPMSLARSHESALKENATWQELGYQPGYPRYMLGASPEKQPVVSSVKTAAPLTQDEPGVHGVEGSGEGSLNRKVTLPSGEWLAKTPHHEYPNGPTYQDLEPEDIEYFKDRASNDVDMEEFASRFGRALSDPNDEPIVPEVIRGNKASDPGPTAYVRRYPEYRDMDTILTKNKLSDDDLSHHTNSLRGKLMGYFHSVLGEGDHEKHHNMLLLGDPMETESEKIQQMPIVSVDHTHSSIPQYAESLTGDDEDYRKQMRWFHQGKLSPYAEEHFLGYGGFAYPPSSATEDRISPRKVNQLGPKDTERALAASEVMRPWAQQRGRESWLDAAQERMKLLGEKAGGTESMFPYQMAHEQQMQHMASQRPAASAWPEVRRLILSGRPGYSIRTPREIPSTHHDMIVDSAIPEYHEERGANFDTPKVYAIRSSKNRSTTFLVPLRHDQSGENGWIKGRTDQQPTKWKYYQDTDEELQRALAGKDLDANTTEPMPASQRYKRQRATGLEFSPLEEGDIPLDRSGHQLDEPVVDPFEDLARQRGWADESSQFKLGAVELPWWVCSVG